MVREKLLAKFSIILGAIVFCNSSFAKDYNSETSETIIIKGEILHADSNSGGGHTFTVSYKGKLYFCLKTSNYTKCYD